MLSFVYVLGVARESIISYVLAHNVLVQKTNSTE
jgi:hypothetical protein